MRCLNACLCINEAEMGTVPASALSQERERQPAVVTWVRLEFMFVCGLVFADYFVIIILIFAFCLFHYNFVSNAPFKSSLCQKFQSPSRSGGAPSHLFRKCPSHGFIFCAVLNHHRGLVWADEDTRFQKLRAA